jgi:hypothetical protein
MSNDSPIAGLCVTLDAPNELEHVILHVLNQLSNEGQHCFLEQLVRWRARPIKRNEIIYYYL